MSVETAVAEVERPFYLNRHDLVIPAQSAEELDWLDKPGDETLVPYVFIRAFSPSLEPQEAKEKTPFNYNSPLDVAGFEVQKDVTGFRSDYQKALIEGKTRKEAFQIALSGRVANIRTYIVEYARQGLVLPHLIDLENGRLVNSYNRQAIIPGINAQERGGAVKAASEKIENFFANTENGIAINTSPEGKLGVFNKGGLEFEYFNCLHLIYVKKADRSFEGVSLVSDMTLPQNQELMRRLRVSADVLAGQTEKEKVENVVKNPALLTPNLGYSISPEEVMEMILDIRGEGDIRLINAKGEVEYRPVAEMRRDMARRAKLLEFSEHESECEGYVNDFIRKVTDAFDSMDSITFMDKLALEEERAIFKITRVVKPGAQKYTQIAYGGYNDLSEREVLLREYASEITYLKERVGCATVGGSRGRMSGYMMSSEIALALAVNPNLEPMQCLACGEVNICGKDKCYACKGTLVKANKN